MLVLDAMMSCMIAIEDLLLELPDTGPKQGQIVLNLYGMEIVQF